ncbi:hypothetical protein A3K24_01610 [candidate division Kazan bacterium RIFCSPHIGHO2_01_FULL_44_14]|uniref:Big-1 domain-containing protein n=1 Tax=candidate division Kazan bacterium RIFCSPLOWO2_01_FULL_45_19 TaxID=1798538 RepID=A0A1F4NQ00_UNCK3|nr:hypothetical protein [uncultured bacterium]OGB73533.1 MAG: hypothetical protein A3K51_01610 [candidate division Kazan bacterium RIFCSPLOWO2_01_FULL_45_19]OGB77778.1 MAG: hypothetical protein A3K24_01610 [candidate division Kazan bacterium RIFCSPHIGHO2_01_FULL_44_14]
MTLYPWQRFTTWLGVPGNRRRFAIGAISVSAVIVAVLFFSQLDFLLRLFGSKAEVTGYQDDLNWKNVPAMSTTRQHHSMVYAQVKTGATIQRRLWVVGGLNETSGTWNALSSVEYLELDESGQPASGNWQYSASMKSPRAAGRLVAVDTDKDGYQDYLYAIVGDMHIAPIILDQNGLPVSGVESGVYSTIERLNLHSPNNWEVVASITDVHYLPEVLVTDSPSLRPQGGGIYPADWGYIHITGGVFGNMWQQAPGGLANGQPILSPVGPSNLMDPNFDPDFWGDNNLGTKPIVGYHPLYLFAGGGLTMTDPVTSGSTITNYPTGSTNNLYGLPEYLGKIKNDPLDSDGDGVADWIEIFLGYDPHDRDSYPGAIVSPDTTIVTPDTNTTVTPEGSTTTTAPEGVTTIGWVQKLVQRWSSVTKPVLAQVGSIPAGPDYSQLYFDQVKSGAFVTTVETHIRLNFSTVSSNPSSWEFGELTTNPYLYANQWLSNRVIKIGQLRVFIDFKEIILPAPAHTVTNIVPVAQGRYGHQIVLIKGPDSAPGYHIYIFGGASFGSVGPETNTSLSPFWVLDDGVSHPADNPVSGTPSYDFVGHSTLKLLPHSGGTSWATVSSSLIGAESIPLKSSQGARGGLFMPTATSTSDTEIYLSGGLYNATPYNVANPIPLSANLSQKFTVSAAGWQLDEPGGLASISDARSDGALLNDNYRFGSYSVGASLPDGSEGKSIVAGGYKLPTQQLGKFHYPSHWQDLPTAYTRVLNQDAYPPKPDEPIQGWMWPFVSGADFRFTSPQSTNLLFTASAGVKIDKFNSQGEKIGTIISLYVTGGSGKWVNTVANDGKVSSTPPTTFKAAEYIGPLFVGAFNQPSKAETIVLPDDTVYADGQDSGIISTQVFSAEDTPMLNLPVTIFKGPVKLGEAPREDIFEAVAGYPIVEQTATSITIQSDDQGTAKVAIKSTQSGDANLLVGAGSGLSLDSVTVHFIPYLTNVIPVSGVQGSTDLQVTLQGAGVALNANAEVQFEPTQGQFTYKLPWVTTLKADGQTPQPIVLNLVDSNGNPADNLPVSFRLIRDVVQGHMTNGQLRDSLVIAKDGLVTTSYQTGTSAGVTYIEASAQGIAPVKIAVVENDPTLRFYNLDLTSEAVTVNLQPPVVPIRMTARLSLSDDSPVPDQLVNFITDNGSAVLNPRYTDANGQAQTEFTAVQPTGFEETIAYATINPGNKFLGDGVSIEKYLLRDNGVTVENIQKVGNDLRFTIDIGTSATLGMWRVSVVQDGQALEWLATPDYTPRYFEVLPQGASNLAYITSITSDRGERNKQYIVDLVGQNTNWLTNHSSVIFEPNDENTDIGDNQGVTATTVSVTNNPDGTQNLRATVVISANATPGWWDVSVHTIVGGDSEEIATKLGDHDFLVQVADSDFIGLQANPTQLVPDNQQTSDLTAVVGWINNTTGVITRRPNVTVNFAKNLTTGGLAPATDTTSDPNGVATSTYTVDNLAVEVRITASSTSRSGAPISATVTIVKIVVVHNLIFKVEANPTTIDLNSSQHWSTITVTLKNADNTPRTNQIVTLILTGLGNLNKTTLLIGSNGTDTATYWTQVADGEGQTRVDASALIAGIGTISTAGTLNGEVIERKPVSGTTKTLNIIAPVEGNRYDYLTQNKVLVIVIGKNDTTPLINNWFKINSSNQIVGLPQISVSTNKIYDVWVKATNHLAVATTFGGSTVSPINLTMLIAKIGDINLTHDNRIDSLDFSVFNLEFARTPVFGDFNGDTKVDSLDFSFLNWNWGWGVDKPAGAP